MHEYDKTYYINEKKRIVTCICRHATDCMSDNIESRTALHHMPAAAATAINLPHPQSMNKCVGFACCHENDDFDETTGRYIAAGRADVQHHNNMIADIKAVRASMLREIEQLDRMLAKEEAARRHSAKVVRELGK